VSHATAAYPADRNDVWIETMAMPCAPLALTRSPSALACPLPCVTASSAAVQRKVGELPNQLPGTETKR
jgi:hypothetical protein